MKKIVMVCLFAVLTSMMIQSSYAQALRFGAAKKLQTATNFTTIVDNLTMECWVRWDGTPGGIRLLVYNGDPSTSGYGYYINTNTAQIHFLAGGVIDVGTGYNLPVNIWTHLALRRTAGTWHLIVNGVQQGWTAGNAPNVPGAPGATVGIDFPGDIDELRVWNIALPTATILNNFQQAANSSHPNFANLVAYYPMNEGTGQTTADAIGGNTMTLGATNAVGADDPTWIADSSPITVPTLGEWAMIIFAVLLVGTAWYKMREKQTLTA